MRQAARRLRALEHQQAAEGEPVIAIVLAAGRPPAAVDREAAELERRLRAAGRHGPRVIVIDR